MTGKIWWVLLLAVACGSTLLTGGWTSTLAQAGPGNWEFFGSPTQSPNETRWGTYRDEARQGREEAVARSNYCPTSGCVVRLDKVAVKPLRVQRGRSASIALTYTVLTAENIGIPVTISREIFHQGKSLGKTTSRNLRTPNGTFEQEVAFDLPANSAPGQYSLKTRISTGYGFDEKSVDFSVE